MSDPIACVVSLSVNTWPRSLGWMRPTLPHWKIVITLTMTKDMAYLNNRPRRKDYVISALIGAMILFVMILIIIS